MTDISSGTRTVYTGYSTELYESLFDKITNISPDETRFLSTLSRDKIDSIYHFWLQESLSTFQDNKWVDGQDFTYTARDARTRVGNWVQTLANTWKIGEIAEAANAIGVQSEFAHEMELSSREHATDIERALIYNTSASGDSATAATLRGIDSWISTYSSTGSASGEFTSSAVNSLLQDIVTGGKSKPYWVVMSPTLKLQSDSWTTSNTRYLEMRNKELTGVVNVYESSFGTLKLEYSIWLDNSYAPSDNYGRAFFIDKSKWSILLYKSTYTRSIPSTGLWTAGAIVTALSLKCLQEACNGKYLASNC